MSTPVMHEHIRHAYPLHADAYDKRFELLGLAASFAEMNGLGRLNATSLARISGIERRTVVRMFPTRSNLIESVWSHQVQRTRQSTMSTKVYAVDGEERVDDASSAAQRQAQVKETAFAGRDEVVLPAELTLEEFLKDPLIELMNRADCVSWRSYAQLMQSAARVLARARSANRDSATAGSRASSNSSVELQQL